jgi:hypothetical protein
MARLTESIVEQATLTWVESLSYVVRHGPDLASEGITRSTLRDTLLPKLLSGEIRVKNVERLNKEALA